MAILALALNPPRRDVLVYSDFSYVVKGCQRFLTSTRRRLRRSNRCLWHQLMEAVSRHKGNGFKFVVAKCAAHGRDDKQAEHVKSATNLLTRRRRRPTDLATSPVCSLTTPSLTAFSSADALSEVTHVAI